MEVKNSLPILGSYRKVRKFAFLPIIMNKNTLVWLEHYDSYQEYGVIIKIKKHSINGWKEIRRKI